ncbi:MAG: DUF1972 domain-containing protein [Rikenellaceae bacterium]
MKKVAVIGSVGVPANYGGFETLVENIIGDIGSLEVEYTVFCSAKRYYYKPKTYKNAKLKYINLNANGIQSILYDGLSLMQAIKGYDVVLVLGISGGVFMPLFKLLSKAKLITNVDGLEWKRGKWRGFARMFLRLSEEFVLKFSDIVIADNKAIVNYIKKRYKKDVELIAYGGDHAIRAVVNNETEKLLSLYKLECNKYTITVCRIEPENNCDMILRSVAESRVRHIMIGNWTHSKYSLDLREKYSNYKNITLCDAIYDLDVLYALRSNAKYYIHGHSAGGTNPSLVEAMFCGCNILAFDVEYNRATTENAANYFKNSIDLSSLLTDNINNSKEMVEIAQKQYKWSDIAKAYQSLY